MGSNDGFSGGELPQAAEAKSTPARKIKFTHFIPDLITSNLRIQ
jgi:hypothetical protein